MRTTPYRKNSWKLLIGGMLVAGALVLPDAASASAPEAAADNYSDTQDEWFTDVLTPGISPLAAVPWCRMSFASDTRVLLDDGTSTPIANIKAGDRVYATDPVTGVSGSGTVLATYVHSDELASLHVSGGSVETTPDHPFWNESESEWQLASELPIGSSLLLPDGSTQSVVGFGSDADLQRRAAYNFTVSRYESYYVSVGDQFVLVHNCGPGNSPVWISLKPFRAKTKTNALSGSKRRYYEWDYTHNDIEMYDKGGYHLGTIHPVTGSLIKAAVAGRRIII